MINRLMLRLALVNALSEQPGEPAPTIAGGAVFDTRLDDLEFDAENIEVPIVLVYTDNDEAVLQDVGSGNGSFIRHIDVRIDIALGSFSKTTDDAQTRMSYSLPTTDAELEALLDLFEAQVYRALYHPIRAASTAFQAMVVNTVTWSSSASRNNDGNNRLAARSINLRLRINPECRPQWQTSPLPKENAVPQFSNAPYLNPLIKALSLDPKNESLMAMLREAAGAGPQIYVPPFVRLSPKVHLRQPTDPSVCEILGRALQSDRPVDLQEQWVVQLPDRCP